MMRWRPKKWWGWFLVPIVWPAWAVALYVMWLGDRILPAVDRCFPDDGE
jgi:hypothetical protein